MSPTTPGADGLPRRLSALAALALLLTGDARTAFEAGRLFTPSQAKRWKAPKHRDSDAERAAPRCDPPALPDELSQAAKPTPLSASCSSAEGTEQACTSGEWADEQFWLAVVRRRAAGISAACKDLTDAAASGAVAAFLDGDPVDAGVWAVSEVGFGDDDGACGLVLRSRPGRRNSALLTFERDDVLRVLNERTVSVSAALSGVEATSETEVGDACGDGLPNSSAARPKRQIKRNDFRESDEPLVNAGIEGIKSGEYRNALDAGRALAGRASGPGEPSAKATRLSRRIRNALKRTPGSVVA